jgi:cell division septation protein DedD
MPNVVSSAITNKPPPQAVANLLAKRNKIHHLDHDTDETLLEIFDRDPGHGDGTNGVTKSATNGTKNGDVKKKTADANHATMPSRNYAIISESNAPPTATSSAAAPAPVAPHSTTNSEAVPAPTSTVPDKKVNMRKPIHIGEQGAGTKHPAAGGLRPTGMCGQYGLDVSIRVEISPSDREGHTDGYGFSIPALEV